MGLRVAIFLLVLHMLSFINFVLSLELEDGEGVCNRTETRNKLVIIHQEVKVTMTTEVPCKVNSWLDEISCMNEMDKGRKIITKTINVSEPVTIKFCCPEYIRFSNRCILRKFCCPEYVRFSNRCILQTTTEETTIETTTKPTTAAVPTELPVITTRRPDTTTLRGTTRMKTDKTTVKPTYTTTSTTRAVTIKPTTRAVTTKPTTTDVTTKPTTRTVTTKPSAKSSEKTTNTKTMSDTKRTTTTNRIRLSTTYPTMKTTSTTTQITTSNAPGTSNKGTEESSKGEAIANILLYVSIGCVLVLIIFVAVILTIYYRRKRYRSKSLTMLCNDGIQNPCYQGTQGGVGDIHDYTSMKFDDEKQEELQGILDFSNNDDGCAEASGLPEQNTNEYTIF